MVDVDGSSLGGLKAQVVALVCGLAAIRCWVCIHQVNQLALSHDNTQKISSYVLLLLLLSLLSISEKACWTKPPGMQAA